MIYIHLPEKTTHKLSFYLAMEEHIARHLNTGDDCFFMWQVHPSVIFGRNQLIGKEVNLPYCQEHGIQIYRRKSGGGCVYADMSNVMFSYITRDENVNLTFNSYLNMVVSVLAELGIEAYASGRNDILIGDRKVSGNAFYHIPGHSIVHGTMLYDTDMKNMVGAITPSDEKLVSKGVESVRQHITLLKDHTDITLSEFMEFVKKKLCQSEYRLQDNDIRSIEEIEREYLSDDFVYGNNPRYTVCKRHHMDGVGDFEIRMELKRGTIRNINLMGDYFLVGDIDNRLLKPLKGIPLDADSISNALPDRLDDIILNLNKEQFIYLLSHDGK